MSLRDAADTTRHAVAELVGEVTDRFEHVPHLLEHVPQIGVTHRRRSVWPVAAIAAVVAIALFQWRRAARSKSSAPVRGGAPGRGGMQSNMATHADVPGTATVAPAAEPAEYQSLPTS
jgi:hypothetical protein